MKKFFCSLQTKLIASFVLLILIIAGGTFLYTFTETKKALKETMQDELKAVAASIATQINGDSLTVLQTGDEAKTSFQQIRDQLLAVRSAYPDIKFVYTMRKVENKVSFIVDADYGNTQDGASVGDVYEKTNPRLIDGFTQTSADDELTVDQWGTTLSGYAPVKNSTGKIVGLVGIDMSGDRVIQKQNFIGNTIYFIIGIAILVAAIIIGIFSLTIIRDIKKLNHSANEISKGNSDIFIDVKRQDEIGELAESFSRMIASLKFMMLDQKENS
jgi:methyl-accepting chemotaxis protein